MASRRGVDAIVKILWLNQQHQSEGFENNCRKYIGHKPGLRVIRTSEHAFDKPHNDFCGPADFPMTAIPFTRVRPDPFNFSEKILPKRIKWRRLGRR